MIIDVETMPHETIVIWNKCSDVLPTDPDDEDMDCGNQFLCKLTRRGSKSLFDYEVCPYDYNDKLFIRSRCNNIYHSVGDVIEWTKFNGCNY